MSVCFTVAAMIIGSLATCSVYANGMQPTVVEGQASFSAQGSTLDITNSPGAIINWQGFSIGANETTRFIQQSTASSVLNRVVGTDPSVILGTLSSNGRVFLINPSGILVGQGARIDVAGLVASSLALSNNDFLAGRFNFAADPLAGNVVNQGRISTPSGGNVYLVGANVTNSGIIKSPQGDVILAAGQSVKIFDTSTPGVRVEVTAGGNEAVNLGEILAQSGEVGIYGAALRNAGIINADQVVRDQSGRIVLRAKQDMTLEAGSQLSANGGEGGHGGMVLVWSDGVTSVAGMLTAQGGTNSGDGGLIETSGNQVLIANGARVNTLASHGKTGLWLLDPVGDYKIATSGGNETPGDVTLSLATTSREIDAANDITVADALTWTTAQTLTLNAGHDVKVDATMTASTAGSGIVLIAGHDVTAVGTVTASANGSVIDMSAGHDVSVTVVTASAGGSIGLHANNDVIVNGAVTADTGLDPVVLTADKDGTGAGTVKFAGGGQASSTLTTIRFNPASYAMTGAEIAAYLPKVVAGALDAKAWVFAQGDNKTYNGLNTATLSFKGTPADGGDVTLNPGTAAFITKDAGLGITINYTGYNGLGGANAGRFALFPGGGITTANITPKALTAVSLIGSVTKAYNGNNAVTNLTSGNYSITGFIGGDGATIGVTNGTYDNGKDVVSNPAGSPVTSASLVSGDYTANGGTLLSNYDLSAVIGVSAAGNIGAITPKALTAVGLVGSVTKAYNGNNAVTNLTSGNYSITGFIGGDGATIGVTNGTYDNGKDVVSNPAGSPVTSASLVSGDYTANGGTLLSNYDLSAVIGVSAAGNIGAITTRSLAVAADALGKVYGALDPALTYAVTGLQLGDTAGSVLTGVLSRAVGESVGNYVIGQNTLAANSNYTLAFTGANLGITPAALQVVADPQSKIFGAADPALTYVANGFQFSDTAGTVLSGALARAPGESVLGGPYDITQGTLAAGSNYTLGFTHNHLLITGAAAESVLGFNAGQVIFNGVINNDFYYRPGNFWHIALNFNNADPGFDVLRGTKDLNQQLSRELDRPDLAARGVYYETWSFPQEFAKAQRK